MELDCGICADTYNKTTRLKIECLYCNYPVCRKCCETWITNETTPICINPECAKEWTRKFMTEVFTKTFMANDYKKHRENILFDQERALLPATQPIVETQLKCERIVAEIERIEREELSAIYKKIRVLKEEKSRLRNPIIQPANERAIFIKACPDSECRGFLSSQWKCGLCDKWTCSNCHEVKGTTRDCEHTCDPDTVATAQLLANDTKSCPACGTGIHKLEGCDQMYCTMCNTAFSWKTGRIETNIHNPHYYEYLRRTGGGNIPRNANDIQCGREITNVFARQTSSILRHRGANDEMTRRVMQICESIIHMRLVDTPKYETDRVANNLHLRIDYLRQRISEDDFKTQVQRVEKKQQKQRDMHNILTMLVNATTDIMFRFSDTATKCGAYGVLRPEDLEALNELLGEVSTIIVYANECLSDVASTYNSKRWFINDALRLRPF